MQITEIRRLMSFGQRENMTMSARLDEGDDPFLSLQALETVMREGIRRYEEASVPRCRICGCTDDHACYGGCYWVEPDLCSSCALSEEYVEAHARGVACNAVGLTLDMEDARSVELVDRVTDAIIDAYRKGRRARGMAEGER